MATKELNAKLMKAAGDWDIPLIQKCLAEGADINHIDESGHTPLIEAVEDFQWRGLSFDVVSSMSKDMVNALGAKNLEKCVEVVKILLDNGADIDLAGPEEEPPLMCAIYSNSTEMIRLLLERGANPNFICYPEHDGCEYRSDAMEYYDWLLYEDYDDDAMEQHYLIRDHGGRLYKYDYERATREYLGKHAVYLFPGNRKGYLLFDNDRWGIGTDSYVDIEDADINKTRVDISQLSEPLKEWNRQFIEHSRAMDWDFDWQAWRNRGRKLAEEILRLCGEDRIALFYLYDTDEVVEQGAWHPDDQEDHLRIKVGGNPVRITLSKQ